MLSERRRGTVKWFNAQKKFGFIKPEEGGKDMFVHLNAVEAVGLSALVEDQHLSFEEDDSDGRIQAVNLIVDPIVPREVAVPKVTGTVQWFNYRKNYGFIQPDGGDKDVFVHAKDLEKAGIRFLGEGERIRFRCGRSTPRSRMQAIDLELVDP